MDTSISKALIMVAGVLLAMIVVAFMTFTFNRMGTWNTAKDDELLIKQAEEFNREFEAYDKNLMYGMDVISCLNKVLSSNEKITKSGYVNGQTYDESYAVTAQLTLKKTLQESIHVYYTKQGETKEKEAPDDWNSGYTLDGITSGKFKFLMASNYKGQFKNLTKLQTQYTNSDMTGEASGTVYKLTYDYNEANDANQKKLRAQLNLIKEQNDLTQTIKNTKDKKVGDQVNGEDYIWTKAVYHSALYDMKTRKFKCTYIGYNTKTGRINEIRFEEY